MQPNWRVSYLLCSIGCRVREFILDGNVYDFRCEKKVDGISVAMLSFSFSIIIQDVLNCHIIIIIIIVIVIIIIQVAVKSVKVYLTLPDYTLR